MLQIFVISLSLLGIFPSTLGEYNVLYEPRKLLKEFDDSPDNLYETHHINIETVYRTEYATKYTTKYDFPTCTLVVSGVPQCQYQETPREVRFLLPLPRNPRFPPRRAPIAREFVDDVANREASIVPSKPLLSNEALTPEPKVIIVRLTTTLTTLVTNTQYNTATTVGITYNGCVPTDAPSTTTCESSP